MSSLPIPILYILAALALLAAGGLIGHVVSGIRRMPTTTAYGLTAPQTDAPAPPPPESWAMKNTDKLLIACLMVFSVLVTLYSQSSKDAAQTQFYNGLTNTLSGCLITLVTGAVLRKTTETTVTKDPETGRQMGIVSVKDEEK